MTANGRSSAKVSIIMVQQEASCCTCFYTFITLEVSVCWHVQKVSRGLQIAAHDAPMVPSESTSSIIFQLDHEAHSSRESNGSVKVLESGCVGCYNFFPGLTLRVF